jgi:ABC transporter transmembrane region 2
MMVEAVTPAFQAGNPPDDTITAADNGIIRTNGYSNSPTVTPIRNYGSNKENMEPSSSAHLLNGPSVDYLPYPDEPNLGTPPVKRSTGTTIPFLKSAATSTKKKYQYIHVPTTTAVNHRATSVARGGDGLFRENSNDDSDDDDIYSTKRNNHSDPSSPTNSESHEKQLPPPGPRQRPSINWSHVREQFQLIFRMGLPYLYESKQSRWLVAGLVVLMILNNLIFILFSYINRDFWSTLAEQNAKKFYVVMIYYFAILLILAPINALYSYQRDQLALHWRAWLTKRTIQLYTTNQVYYNIEVGRKKEIKTMDGQDGTIVDRYMNRNVIDNPDQRIAEDVQAFTALSIDLCFDLFGSIIQIFSFSAILWTIYPQLLLIAFAYAFAGTIVTTILGHPLIHLNVEHLRREADLRYSLVRFRENAEAIAFYLRAAIIEHDFISGSLNHVVSNQYRINVINRTMNLFTYAYSLSLDILPVIIVVRSLLPECMASSTHHLSKLCFLSFNCSLMYRHPDILPER